MDGKLPYMEHMWPIKGVLDPKFEHMFVAVIPFSPFLMCKYFWYQLVVYCVCFKMISKKYL